jgi:hypothetical protein
VLGALAETGCPALPLEYTRVYILRLAIVREGSRLRPSRHKNAGPVQQKILFTIFRA